MPVYKIYDDQRVRVILKGFFVAHIEEGVSPAEIFALAPSLITIPPIDKCHQPKVSVYMTDKGTGETTVTTGFSNDRDFSVEVDKGSPAIEVFHKDANPFVPFDIHNHPKDFRWFVNLNEVHGLSGPDKVTMKTNPPVGPIFTINDGLFHTSDRSDGEVRLQRLRPDHTTVESERAFGRFGLELTARVYLTGDDTAAFFNGELLPIFTATAKKIGQPDLVYDIVYDCRCLTDEDVSDFKNIYHVIDLPGATRRVNMVADRILPLSASVSRKRVAKSARKDLAASPETYCTGGTFP